MVEARLVSPTSRGYLPCVLNDDSGLADVESILGAERYARLRAVGGLGLLVEAAQCEEPSAAAAP